jgi:hypothetical protein
LRTREELLQEAIEAEARMQAEAQKLRTGARLR